MTTPLNRETLEHLTTFIKQSKLSNEDAQHIIDTLNRSPEVFKTLHWIGRQIDEHFNDNPMHGYNCTCMDRLITEWRATVQSAKPDSDYRSKSLRDVKLRAFRHVMVVGERDW